MPGLAGSTPRRWLGAYAIRLIHRQMHPLKHTQPTRLQSKIVKTLILADKRCLMDLDIWEDSFVLLLPLHNGCKVIISKDHIRSSLRNPVPVIPIPILISASFKWWCIINSVTCHGNNFTFLCHAFNDTNLVFRWYTSINRGCLKIFWNSSSEFIQLSSSEDMVFCIIWSMMPRRLAMAFSCICGLWSWLDTCFFSDTYSFCSFWTLRVNHADQTWEDEVRLQRSDSKVGTSCLSYASHQ